MKKLAIAAVLLTSFSANAFIFKSLASKMAGIYTVPHTVMVIDHDEEGEGGWVEAQVEDQMVISKISRKRIKVEFTTWFTNGHSCGLEGIANKEGKKFVFLGEDDFDGRTCKLEITLDKENGLTLKDESGACKWSYCGMRGYIDGTTFGFKK